MLNKLKDILGIEGVKIQLICPEEIEIKADHLAGQIILTSKSPKTIEGLTIKLIEKYKRGRNESTLINEYLLSSLDIEANLDLESDQVEKIDFSLPVSLLLSDMDQFERKNIFTAGLAKVAKKLKNVSSYYRVEVSAKVKGLSLDAVAQQNIKLI